ncbi:MAG TPA: hypothetical protein VHG93_27925 [Longimicrobium sp.]|nr:hypothetical protein [Longimicrobium sp.]
MRSAEPHVTGRGDAAIDQDRYPDSVPREDRGAPPPAEPPVETERHPAPGITHEPEPDAENIIPIDDQPGTF